MSLQHLPLAQIKEADLQRLVNDATRESRSIDYKQTWGTLSKDQDKREFLADVASFANAGGGDLVYGVSEADGLPVAILGLDGFLQDQEQLRVEQMLKTGISPRLTGVAFGTVTLASGKGVFIIRVPRSWSAPHMVIAGGFDRFFSRHSNGKYQLDVNELRAAFLQSAHAGDRIRDFRLERVNCIATGDVGVRLSSKTCFVWHLMPLGELPSLDVKKVLNMDTQFRPMGEISSWGHQMNFDGIMVRTTLEDGSVQSYVQVFRNGCIEAVYPHPGMERLRRIDPAFEETLRQGLINYLGALPRLGVAPPYFVALSLLNVGGFAMAVPADVFPRRQAIPVIDRPHLLIPEVAVDAEPAPVDAIARPIFDLVWNACGYLNSPNFDEHGRWKPTR